MSYSQWFIFLGVLYFCGAQTTRNPWKRGFEIVHGDRSLGYGNNYRSYKNKEDFGAIVHGDKPNAYERDNRSYKNKEKNSAIVHGNKPHGYGKYRYNRPYNYEGSVTNNNLQQSQDQAKGSYRFLRIDHITWWVGNAKQAAQYYCLRLGFKPLAYQGSNAGSSEVASHVVSQGDIVLVFKSVYNNDTEKIKFMGEHLAKHGDGVRDVAFEVVDLYAIVQTLMSNGVKLIKDIWEESDEGGAVRFARVQPFGDTVHTFVERRGYKGLFLPGYNPPLEKDNLLQNLPSIKLGTIDHVVEAVPDQGGEDLVNWYTQNLMFKPFTSPDNFVMHTNYSSRKTRVVVNSEDTKTIRLPIIETAKGWVQSAIEKFVNAYDGGGVEHVAFTTDNLVECVKNMRYRGQQFLDIPDAYYDDLKISLKESPVEVTESIDLLQKLRILIDYDDHGYLLQIFTKHLQDRTSIFLEVIQRKNHEGLGAGNFQRLFEAIQKEGGNPCIEGVICKVPTSPSYREHGE